MARAIAVLLAACALAAPARADFQVWSEAGVSAEVVDGLRLGFDQEVRLDDGASELDLVRPAAWGSWRAARWLSLRLGYRYAIEPHFTKGADYADGWHEGWLDATLRQRFGRLRGSLRLRLEEKRGRPWDEDGALVRKETARQRLALEWPLRWGLSAVGSGELFLRLGDSGGHLDEWGGGLGVTWEAGRHAFEVRYLYVGPFAAEDEPSHVLELAWSFAP